ncbi:endogenous retrovirus group S71 member 1 Env polyprotein-like [Hipposideros larvatus]
MHPLQNSQADLEKTLRCHLDHPHHTQGCWDPHLDTPHPSQTYTTGSRREMENTQQPPRSKDKTWAGPLLTFLLFTMFFSLGLPSPPPNPDAPWLIRWELRKTGTSQTFASLTQSQGQPVSLITDLCRLDIPWMLMEASYYYGGPRGVSLLDYKPGCHSLNSQKRLWGTQFYACPASGPPHCKTKGEYFCASWGCETAASWKNKDPNILISLTRNKSCKVRDTCNPLNITIVQPNSRQWDKGRTWGFRLYLSGPDLGTQFTIQRFEVRSPPQPIGPNKDIILPTPVLPPLPTHSNPRHLSIPGTTDPPRHPQPPATNLGLPATPNLSPRAPPLFQMLTSVHALLNFTNPEEAQDCWLCLDPKPPYYLGLGTVNSSLPLVARNSCTWAQPSLTLGNLQGQGTCIFSQTYSLPNSPYAPLCESTLQFNDSYIEGIIPSKYLQAPPDTWFACTNGITKCIDLWLLHSDESPPIFCYLVYILPQVQYYSGEEGREHLNFLSTRYKRAAPKRVPLLVGLGIAGSAAVGTFSLIVQDQNFKSLSHQVAQDLGYLESFVSRLELQVDSLAEVVLQNRRGLDLLFLKQSGLCVALGETCCFYANQSGVIRDTLALVRKDLKEKYLTQTNQQNRYQSPWLTNLISALTGPLVLLLIAFLVGPCILYALTSFVRRQVSQVKLLDTPLQDFKSTI